MKTSVIVAWHWRATLADEKIEICAAIGLQDVVDREFDGVPRCVWFA
jgi:hypothetical protein